MNDLKNRYRFYFITDDAVSGPSPPAQAEIAIRAGAGIIQYRNKAFKVAHFEEARAIRRMCRVYRVPFIINDDILLAKALEADGVHLGQTDDRPGTARQILGPEAIIGISVSTPAELEKTDLSGCDYVGTGPVYDTGTKADAGPVIGLSGLHAMVEKSPLPVVAIGGLTASRAKACFAQGAAGAAVISDITRAGDPGGAARAFAQVCGCAPRPVISAWSDEFGLIAKLLEQYPPDARVRVRPGDDAALLAPFSRPVITTDTQQENVHFKLAWQSFQQIGDKAAEITFSDLAACYAAPAGLFINLTLPPHMTEAAVEELYRGISGALQRHHAFLGGGNLSSGSRFSIDLFAIGEGRADIFPARSNAKAGEGVYATGPLGLARAGLAALKKNDPGFPKLVERFISPRARFDAADVLAARGVGCVMDISDGLAGDAAHVAKASGISIVFEPEGFRMDPDLVRFCGKFGLDPAAMILSGGEDYELLFTCRPEQFDQIQRRMPGAFRVGTCIAYAGRPVLNLPSGISSYQHGKIS